MTCRNTRSTKNESLLMVSSNERERERENKHPHSAILNDEKSWYRVMGFVFFKDGLLFMYIISESPCLSVHLSICLFIPSSQLGLIAFLRINIRLMMAQRFLWPNGVSCPWSEILDQGQGHIKKQNGTYPKDVMWMYNSFGQFCILCSV